MATLLCAPYTLEPLDSSENSPTARFRSQGLLLKEDAGYACLHPWPGLGDAPLEHQLASLSGQVGETPLVRAARSCLALDARARSEKRSLFAGLAVPASHASLGEASLRALQAAAEAGYREAKIKLSPANFASLPFLLDASPLPLRIDTNERGDPETLASLWDNLSPRRRAKIRFWEDPFPYDPIVWSRWHRQTGCPLALDRQSARAREGGFQILVVKPAIDDLRAAEEFLSDTGLPFLVTSYMDHPLGQAYAAYEAGRLAAKFPEQILVCGLHSHRLFRQNIFSEGLGSGPEWMPPSGTGLGFNRELTSVEWRRVP